MDADVILREIQFNHDRQGATHDAFNIRFNEANAVELPEWRRGATFTAAQCPAAYAINETRGHILTIRASFTGPANTSVLIRAVQARPDRAEKRGCNPIGRLWPGGLKSGAGRANVLGEVVEREIRFDVNGRTDLKRFTLKDVLIWKAGVSVSNTEWRWQFREKRTARWTDFAITRHRIYTVLEIPNCPWQQNPLNEAELTQLPWAEALEYACDWAAGTQNPDEAATLITRNIYNLGRVGRVQYSFSSFYTCPNFDCTKFLQLLNTGIGVEPRMNCDDCATSVSTFANLVGCNLRQLDLGPVFFTTNLVKLIGFSQEDNIEFIHHEVAWNGCVTEDGKVFDACLQVDGDAQPDAPPFEPLLPTNIRFGSPSDRDYRFRLNPDVFIRPDTLTCRRIGNDKPGGCRTIDETLRQFVETHYDFASWRSLPPKKTYLPDGALLKRVLLPMWTPKLPFQEPKFVDAVNAIRSLWFVPTDSKLLVRLDIVELSSWQQAREFLLRKLGEFDQLRVQRVTNSAVGDVCFADPGHLAVLFARSQFVALVRSAGLSPTPVFNAAADLDDYFLNSGLKQAAK